MRKFKFRVWRKSFSAMACNEQLKEILKFVADSTTIKGVLVPENENAVVMQYIGRLDINGKEIYEGDVVKATDSYDNIKFCGMVCYRDCSFIIRNSYCSYYRWMDYDVEVIGNIYENPDLLEDLEIMEKIKKRDEESNGKLYTLDELKEMFNL